MLLPDQVEALKWIADPHPPARLLIWMGDVRSGKTFGSSLCSLTHLSRYRNSNGIVAGKSIAAVHRNQVPPLTDLAQMAGAAVSARYDRIAVGSNQLHLFGAPDSRAAEVLQGMAAVVALCDEATTLPEDFVAQCVARCDDADARLILTGNYSHPYHWLRGWLDRVPHVLLESELRTAVDAGVISESTYEFFDSTLTGHRKKRWLGREWAAASGVVWPSCVPSDDAVSDPAFRQIEAGIDFGIESPTAALFFGDLGDGRWQSAAEYYFDPAVEGHQRTAGEHAAAILTMGERLGCTRYVIDPSAAPLRLEMRRRGMPVRDGDNKRDEGIDVVESALAEGRLLLTDEGHAGDEPGEFYGGVPNLLREASIWSWVEGKPDTPQDRDDHAPDGTRYWAMWRLRERNLTPFPKPDWL